MASRHSSDLIVNIAVNTGISNGGMPVSTRQRSFINRIPPSSFTSQKQPAGTDEAIIPMAETTKSTKVNIPSVYEYNEYVGAETRYAEFKLSFNIDTPTLSAYMAGFLNSSRSGTMYFGVDDSGRVKGTRWLEISEVTEVVRDAAQLLEPPLSTHDFSVLIVPVQNVPVWRQGTESVVVVLRLHPVSQWAGLYTDRGGKSKRYRGEASSGQIVAADWVRQQVEYMLQENEPGAEVVQLVSEMAQAIAAYTERIRSLTQNGAAVGKKT